MEYLAVFKTAAFEIPPGTPSLIGSLWNRCSRTEREQCGLEHCLVPPWAPPACSEPCEAAAHSVTEMMAHSGLPFRGCMRTTRAPSGSLHNPGCGDGGLVLRCAMRPHPSKSAPSLHATGTVLNCPQFAFPSSQRQPFFDYLLTGMNRERFAPLQFLTFLSWPCA